MNWDHELEPSDLAHGRLALGAAAALALRAGPVSLQLGERGPIELACVVRRGRRLFVEADALGPWLRARCTARDRLRLRLVGCDHLVLAPPPLPAWGWRPLPVRLAA